MPELPEVEALAQFLRDHAVGAVVGRVDVAALSAVKTFDPPVTALSGRDVTGANRWGKFLGMDCGGLWLITHLSRGGWLRWVDEPNPLPPKPGGKSPLALRVHFFTPEGATPAIDLTEAGTKKRLAVYIVDDPKAVPGIARLGPDALAVTEDEFAALLRGTSQRIKTALVDQTLLAGIGNAYSDEILHAARLSPVRWTSRLADDEVERLRLSTVQTLQFWTARLRAEVGDGFPDKVTAFRDGMAVHGRFRKPCPVCGQPVQRIRYADNECNYCAECQCGGRLLADRGLSQLLKKDWPKTLAELEERRAGG